MARRSVVRHEPCQRKHHVWFEGTDPDWVPAFNLAGEVEVCDRCGAVRRRGIDANGNVATVQYLYPDGYSMPKDERPSKQELRAEWYKRERRKGRRLSAVAS